MNINTINNIIDNDCEYIFNIENVGDDLSTNNLLRHVLIKLINGRILKFMEIKKQKFDINFCSKYNVRKNFIKTIFNMDKYSFNFDDFLRFNSNAYNIVFHGTSIESAHNICNYNFDIKKRNRQRLGKGEYFTDSIKTAYKYSKGAIVIVLLLKDDMHVIKINDVFIVKNGHFMYCCPIGIIYHEDNISQQNNINNNIDYNIDHNIARQQNNIDHNIDHNIARQQNNIDHNIDHNIVRQQNCYPECCSLWCPECFINCHGESMYECVLCVRHNIHNKYNFCYCREYYDILGHTTSFLSFISMYSFCCSGGFVLIGKFSLLIPGMISILIGGGFAALHLCMIKKILRD
jgi:hypothetical protein